VPLGAALALGGVVADSAVGDGLGSGASVPPRTVTPIPIAKIEPAAAIPVSGPRIGTARQRTRPRARGPTQGMIATAAATTSSSVRSGHKPEANSPQTTIAIKAQRTALGTDKRDRLPHPATLTSAIRTSLN
jgi:hypothetical protein